MPKVVKPLTDKEIKASKAKEKEYKLSEMENNTIMQGCYKTASVMLRPIIKLINDSETFVRIDLYSEDLPKFSLINITEEVKKGLTEFNISIQ